MKMRATLLIKRNNAGAARNRSLGRASRQASVQILDSSLSPMRRITRTFPVACSLECAIETSTNSELS